MSEVEVEQQEKEYTVTVQVSAEATITIWTTSEDDAREQAEGMEGELFRYGSTTVSDFEVTFENSIDWNSAEVKER